MAASPSLLKIPSSTRYLSEVRTFVRQQAGAAGFEEGTVDAIALAVDEACTNVIEHAYGGVATSNAGELETPVEVHIEADEHALRVHIRDRGVAFDRSAYEKPDIQKFAKRRKAGGFGVHIMHRLMDRVEYRTREGTNECILTKYRA